VVASIGPLATISREPGQARKGAATAVDLCAEGVLVEVASMPASEIYFISLYSSLFTRTISFELTISLPINPIFNYFTGCLKIWTFNSINLS